MKSQDLCPFGQSLQRYWENRYEYFSRFDHGIKMDAEGLHTVMPERAAMKQTALLEHCDVILDGFCGVGGISIAYARAGKQVIAVDLNKERLAMARNNARIYKVESNIQFIHGNFFEFARSIYADAVILDPPWGWPRQKKRTLFHLKDMQPSGDDVLAFSLKYFDTVILRTPLIFDLLELEKFNVHYKIYKDKVNGKDTSLSILINSN